jgi:DNA polymerase
VGKTTVLGAGYGMGAPKFMDALRGSGVEITLDESRRIIQAYRETNYAIVGLWKQGQSALTALCQGATTKLGKDGVLTLVPDEMGIRLPNGLLMRYSGLNAEQGMNGLQYTYKTRRGLIKIYGGKVIENVVQALARIVVGEQMILIAKKYRPVLTVHDAIACVVPQEEALSAQVYIEECMRTAPSWASGLPVNCESGIGQSYGEC